MRRGSSLDGELNINGITTEDSIIFKDDVTSCTAHIEADLNKKQKLIYLYGPFIEKESAEISGKRLYMKIVKTAAKNGVGLYINDKKDQQDISKVTVQTASTNEFGKKYFKEQQNIPNDIEVQDEVLGLKIYDLKNDISKVSFLAQRFNIPVVKNMKLEMENEVDKYLNSYALINASNIIKEVRISFLLLIMAIENLVSDRERESNNFCNSVDNLIEQLKTNEDLKNIVMSSFDNDEYQAIITKLENRDFKYKSIGEKCRNLIRECNLTNMYHNKSAEKFWKECYELRSSFVHSGNVSDVIFEILPELKKFVFDILKIK